MKDSDTIHPIIKHPHTYKLVHISWEIDQEDLKNSYLDLHFKKGNELKKLRFFQPVELQIDHGFDGHVIGMEILDIRNRQLDSIGVEVRNFEQDSGITFQAYKVVEIE